MTSIQRNLAIACAIVLVCASALAAKPETWMEVRSPHFIIISNAAEKDARQTAARFEQIRDLFRQMLVFAQGKPSPTITIFALKNEDSLRDLLPEFWAKGHGHIAGIFLDRFDQFYAAVELDAAGDNPYSIIYHEYYHSLTMPYLPGLPLWLSEGLAEFFGNARIEGKKAYAGQPDAGLIQMFRQSRWIPLETLVSVDYTSAYYNEQNKMSEFYAESWALVHYLMIGDSGAHRQTLVTYLDALDHGATAQQAASQAFGDLRGMEATLQDYVQSGRFYQLVTDAPARIADSSLQVRPLSEAEIDAEKGGFEAVRGQTEQAESLLDEAIRLDPNLALARRNLALAELFDGKSHDALDAASKAIALDPKDSSARYLRAYLIVHSRGTARDPEVEDDLRQCIAADPDFAPAYALLGFYLASDRGTLSQSLPLIQKAIALQPGTTAFQIDLAAVLLRSGRYGDARTVALRARANAIRPEDRARADQLVATVDRVEGSQSDADSPESGAAGGVPPAQHGAEGPPASSEVPSRPPVSPSPQGASEVTGVVAKVSCSPAMRLEVTTSNGTYDLYTSPGEQTRFKAASQPPSGFNPCSSLKGLRVTVHYAADEPGSRQGKIELLEIPSWTSE